MPYRITLECPLDGLQLVNNAVVTLQGGPPPDVVPHHVHLSLPNAPMTCANGHRWRIVPADTIQLLRDQ